MPIKFTAKPFLWRFAVWTVIILLGLFVYRTGYALYHNYQLRDKFTPAVEATPYQDGIRMEKMDLSVYDAYFPKGFSLQYIPLENELEVPVTLNYYTEIPNGETAPALEIKKGTVIILVPDRSGISRLREIGYGYTSYPTYEKGWRIVRPFKTVDAASHSEQYYYVSIDSLDAVMDKVIKENLSLRSTTGWTLNQAKYFPWVRYIDNLLYQNGAYLSPDLLYRVMDRWNIMLLGAIGIIIAACSLGYRSRHYKKAS